MSYYQLIQRDVDGSERKYSPISHQCDNQQISELRVYPNPNNGNFKIEYYTDRKMAMELCIMDVNGRKISSKVYHLQAGSSSLFVSENLVQGMYILQVVAGKKILKPIKFIVE